MVVITFEESAKKEILAIFNKTIDDEDFIVEKNDTTQRVVTLDGEEIAFEEFAGIRKGSEIFIKSNLPSIIDVIDKVG